MILYTGLRKLCPNAQIIMLALKPTPIYELFITAQENMEFNYFPQPWDEQSLLAHIEATIGMEPSMFSTALALGGEQQQRISYLLDALQKNVSARSIHLMTDLGQVLDYKGNEFDQIGEISSLLGGSFAALQQLGTTQGEQGPAASLIHRLGEKEDLYALSVGQQAFLVLRFSRGPNVPRIGTVAFYARQTVTELSGILAESRGKPTKPFVSGDVRDTLKIELEQLFTTSETDPAPTGKPDRLLTFTQALKKGLVSKSLINRWSSEDPINQEELPEGETK